MMTIRLFEETDSQLTAIAKALGVSKNAFIEEAVKAHIQTKIKDPESLGKIQKYINDIGLRIKELASYLDIPKEDT